VDRVLIIMAKAPVPGRVKTRLCPPATPRQAAELAAAALADTVAAARRVPAAQIVLALDGDLDDALRASLRGTTLITQRGDSLGERIAAVHEDVAGLVPGACTAQVGMDTPQLDPAVLDRCLHAMARPGGPDAALGPATDGGWWALGLRDPQHAHLLRDVPTSQADTGARTRNALQSGGLRVATLPQLTDVDTMADAHLVARVCPDTHFAAALRLALAS
jgi:rSAM/selenodomain-associated transferase 1